MAKLKMIVKGRVAWEEDYDSPDDAMDDAILHNLTSDTGTMYLVTTDSGDPIFKLEHDKEPSN